MKTIKLNGFLHWQVFYTRRNFVVNSKLSIVQHAYCRESIYNSWYRDYEVIYLFCKISDSIKNKNYIETTCINFNNYIKQYCKLLQTKKYFEYEFVIIEHNKVNYFGVKFNKFKFKEPNKKRYYFKLPLLIARNAHKTENNLIDIFKSDKRNFKQEMLMLNPSLKGFFNEKNNIKTKNVY